MLILLDIDGVMVPANSWRKPEFLNDGFPAFSKRATSALQKVISATSANILLTTSHKTRYSLNEWKSIFEHRDIKINNIECLPENTSRLNRKDEIMNWYRQNSFIGKFIIIDDDKSLNGLPPSLKNKLIQTSASVGLTDELAQNALIKSA